MYLEFKYWITGIRSAWAAMAAPGASGLGFSLGLGF